MAEWLASICNHDGMREEDSVMPFPDVRGLPNGTSPDVLPHKNW